MVKYNPIFRNLALSLAIAGGSFAIQAQPAHAAGSCSIRTRSGGKVYAKLLNDPGGDGALYVYVDGVQTTWFSTQGRWFYVTSKKNAVVTGYDSELEREC